MKRELNQLEERLKRKNSKDARELKEIYIWYRCGVCRPPIEAPEDTVFYE